MALPRHLFLQLVAEQRIGIGESAAFDAIDLDLNRARARGVEIQVKLFALGCERCGLEFAILVSDKRRDAFLWPNRQPDLPKRDDARELVRQRAGREGQDDL